MSQISTLIIKNSSATSAVPALSSLTSGELALNITDGLLFFKREQTIASISSFCVQPVSDIIYTQPLSATHFIYNDDDAGETITAVLLPPNQQKHITCHKKIGSTAQVILSAQPGTTIDGSSYVTLTEQYQSIKIFSDGSNYFIE
jgi:hypothetical protein